MFIIKKPFRLSIVIVGIFYTLCLLFITVPILSLVINNVNNVPFFSWNEVYIEAIMVSLKSTLISLVIVLIIGTPAAYGMARLSFRGKAYLDILINIPLVLPPAVVGLLLLMTFGSYGFIGAFLHRLGIRITFSLAAVVIAQIFVSLPLYLKTVSEGFRNVDQNLEITAMTLGDSRLKVFRRVTLPLASSSIITGAIMAWARALAEFGATMMFAGNLQGKTQTLPLAIYASMESDLGAAISMARTMVILSMGVLVITYVLASRSQQNVKL